MYIILPDLETDHRLPLRNTRKGADLSPCIRISKIPEEAVSLALIMVCTDRDQSDKDYVQWVLWNIEKTEELPEGYGSKKETALIRRPVMAIQGKTGGRNAYLGPTKGLFDHSVKNYEITLYAVNCRLDKLRWESGAEELLEALRGRIICTAKETMRF